MRVLIIHNYYKIPGGEDTVVANEKKLLESHGHEVFLYTRNNGEMDAYSRLQKLTLPINTVFSLRSYKEVSRILDEKHIDIMHVHNTVCVISPSVYYAAFSKRIPVLQTIHNFRLLCPAATFLRDGFICDECVDHGLMHSIQYACYRSSKLQTFALAFTEAIHKEVCTYKKLNYICLTDFNKEQLLRINSKRDYIDPERVYVKPNFVLAERKCIPFKERKDQIIYAGRIDQTKGIKVLFEAWKHISQYELVVCGTGPLDDWCRRYIESNHISNIKMLGFVTNNKVLDILSESKATILPTQWYEGFPMTLVESFSCGTPVIGSGIGNVGSIIDEGRNGFYIDPTSSASIVEVVNRLTDLCETTYESAKILYSSEQNYKQLIEIYSDVLKGD